MHISHIRLTVRQMTDEIKSPGLLSVGWRRQTNSMWSCGGCLAALTSLSLYLSCFILHHLSNFSLGLCAFLSFISFISISIICPNYTVQADQTQMEIRSIIRWKQKKWRLYRFCSTWINVGVLRRSSRPVPATSPAWARPINLFPAKKSWNTFVPWGHQVPYVM